MYDVCILLSRECSDTECLCGSSTSLKSFPYAGPDAMLSFDICFPWHDEANLTQFLWQRDFRVS